MANQLSFLYEALGDFFAPLSNRLSTLEGMEYLFFRYGWDVPLSDADFDLIHQQSNIVTLLEDLLREVEALQESLEGSEDNTPDSAQIIALVQASSALLNALVNLDFSNLTALPEPLNQSSFWHDIGEHLIDDLLEEYLRIYYPHGYLVLHFFGVIRYDALEPAETHRRPYTRTCIDWGQAIEMIKNPVSALQQAYHWDDPGHDFDHQRFLAALERVLRAVGISAQLIAPDTDRLSGLVPNASYDVVRDEDALRLHFLYRLPEQSPAAYEIGLDVLPAIRANQSSASGLLLSPLLRGGIGTDLSVGSDFVLRWLSNVDAGNALAAALFPDGIEWAEGQVELDVSLEFATEERTEPFYLFGNANTTRIESSGFSIRLSMEGPVDDPEIKVRLSGGGTAGDSDLKVVIPLDESDGFIQGQAGKSALEFAFAAEVMWSSKTGLHFNGNAALDVELPVGLRIGGVTLQRARLALAEGEQKNGQSSLALSLRTGLQGVLGPLSVVVEELGFLLQMIPYSSEDIRSLPPGSAPLLGNLDLDLSFAPPKGVGLSLDSSVVSGGGYLFFDAEKSQYAGALQLQFETFALSAIGLLTTRMPDGTRGFSLLIMLAVENFPAVELGLGFKLTGIGGLLGINRTVAVDVLQAGLKNKTLDRVLFPPDPVANAPAIISSLRSVFPPTPHQYVFGPVAQLAWGKEGLLTAEVGLVLEFPSPLRLLLLGQMRAAFPTPEEPLVRLNLDVLGVIDFDKGEALVLAILFDSQLLAWNVSGDAAFFLRWKNQPTFILSVGGFHPDFNTPPEVPALSRLTMLLSKGDAVQLRMTWYLALTSNTLQHGSWVDLRIKASKFRVDGHLGYDALFQFDPFYFVIAFSAGVALKWGSRTLASIQLEGSLAGPSPWHVQGKATFKIWRFSKSVKFDKTLGEAETLPPLPVVDAKPALLAALEEPSNWQAALPALSGTLVTLKPPSHTAEVMLHPLGTITVRQQVVPLGSDIAKFGHAKVSRVEQYRITQVKLHDAVVPSQAVEEYFAPGEYTELTQSEQLSHPSFALMAAGMSATGGESLEYEEVEVVHRRSAELSYETDLIVSGGDVISLEAEDGVESGVEAEQLMVQSEVGAAAQSRSSRSGLNRFTSVQPKQVEVQGLDYVVTTRDNVSVDVSELEALPSESESEERTESPVSHTSYHQALQLIRAYERRYPEQAKQLQVVPKYEARELAIK